MLRLLADENFNNIIVRGLLRLNPNLDLVRIQETEIVGAEDPIVLEWAAQEERVLLTHDFATIPQFAFERVSRGLTMYGVIEVNQTASFRLLIQQILLLTTDSPEDGLRDQVVYLPLR